MLRDSVTGTHHMAIRHVISRAHTVRTVTSLRGAGVDCLLLKGVSHEDWLFPDGKRPLSRDVDLLVAPNRLQAAWQVLEQLGMSPDRDPVGPLRDKAELRFVSAERTHVPVELHTTFHFATVSRERCWQVLSADRDSIALAGVRIDVPGVPARALLLASHVVAHGVPGEWVVEDLRRALGLLTIDDWRHAAALGRELGASRAFSLGLRVLPAGRDIAEGLGLPDPDDPTLQFRLRRGYAPTLKMVGYAHGTQVGSLARLLNAELIPRSEQMRTWYPLARQGRRGLVAAHVARLARLAGHAPALVADWRRARDAARGLWW
jgi:hypothetical protein